MTKRYFLAFLLPVAFLVFADRALAQTVEFPSHCAPDETVFLSAKMKKVITSPKGISYKDTGKILSLCADKSKDPISKLSYRFGPLGNVDLEQVATSASKFGYADLGLGIKVSEAAYFFHVGEFSYYVTVASGMGSGISLKVFQGKKKVVDLFSGNDENLDFVMPFAVAAKSVLATRKPKHPIAAH